MLDQGVRPIGALAVELKLENFIEDFVEMALVQ